MKLVIVGLLHLASQQEVVQAKMLPHMTATNPYYFPVMIVPVLFLRLSTKASKSMLLLFS